MKKSTMIEKEWSFMNNIKNKKIEKGNVGIGTDRKNNPVFTGVLKYFPDAIMEVSRVSLQGNIQHHPDKPLHWDRNKSNDDFDALARHLIDAGTIDDDGIRHTAKVAWRALACLQKELEKEKSI